MISNPEGCPTARPTKIKAMLELRELKQFHKVFLQNQLCRNLQSAMADLKTRGSATASSQQAINFHPSSSAADLSSSEPSHHHQLHQTSNDLIVGPIPMVATAAPIAKRSPVAPSLPTAEAKVEEESIYSLGQS